MSIRSPEWPVFGKVRAVSTTREGGFSQPPYNSFNTAMHVDDKPENVTLNRELLSKEIAYPIQWLNQVHGTSIVEIDTVSEDAITADAAFTSAEGRVCAVQTADCLPILICDKNGTQVAAVHAGWRGLAAGIISLTIAKFTASPELLCAWLGPAISQPFFEVGEEVRDAFSTWAQHQGIPESKLAQAFRPANEEKYQADLYALARFELTQLGLRAVFGGEACTWRDEDQYFSYRREGVTGRMTSAIWIEPN